MADSADLVRQLNRVILEGLQAKEVSVVAREAEARRIIDACEAELAFIKAQRDSVLQAERLQLDALERGEFHSALQHGPHLPKLRSDEVMAPETGDGGASRKKRARIGPQRYLMLVALREGGDLTQEAIEKWTSLAAKRVREQIKLDVDQGVIEEVEGDDPRISEFALSESGFDLLTRFEDYKRRKGERLPTIADVRDDGSDEVSTDEGAAPAYEHLDPSDAPPSRTPAFN